MEIEILVDDVANSVRVPLPYSLVVDPDAEKSLSALREKMISLGGVFDDSQVSDATRVCMGDACMHTHTHFPIPPSPPTPTLHAIPT